jgi:flavin-binding protein dodecin
LERLTPACVSQKGPIRVHPPLHDRSSCTLEGQKYSYKERLLSFRFLLRAYSNDLTEERTMSMVKVIELSSESPESWEDATRQAVERASRTIRDIRAVWVKEFEAVVDGSNLTQFRVNVKISFELDEAQSVESTGTEDTAPQGLEHA